MLRTLIDNLPDLIYVKDVNGRFLLANAAVTRVMSATSPKELPGRSDFDFHPKGLAARYHEDEQAVIRSGRSSWSHRPRRHSSLRPWPSRPALRRTRRFRYPKGEPLAHP